MLYKPLFQTDEYSYSKLLTRYKYLHNEYSQQDYSQLLDWIHSNYQRCKSSLMSYYRIDKYCNNPSMLQDITDIYFEDYRLNFACWFMKYNAARIACGMKPLIGG